MARAFRFSLTAAMLLGAAAAQAADAPQMKPGLWEVASTFDSDNRGDNRSEGRREGRRAREPMTMTVQHCVGPKMESGLWDPSRAVPGGQKCAPARTRREGNAFIVETECKQGETNVKARVSTIASSDRFDSDMVFNYDPPRRGRATGGMKLAGRFLGACPADLKPGAMRMTGMPVPGAVPPTAK